MPLGNLNWTLDPDGRWKAETPGGIAYTIEQTASGFQLGTEQSNGTSTAGGASGSLPSGQYGTIGVYSSLQRAQEAALAHARAHQLI
jgi:hypothetical protein